MCIWVRGFCPACLPSALQGLRGALNALLFRTGDQSRDFAVVLATNRPADLDAAVLDRMDEALEFGLPSTQVIHQISPEDVKYLVNTRLQVMLEARNLPSARLRAEHVLVKTFCWSICYSSNHLAGSLLQGLLAAPL